MVPNFRSLRHFVIERLQNEYIKNPRIRTITSKNLLPKMWGFSVILPEPVENGCFDKFSLTFTMDYLRMDGKQYASKVRNKALEDFDWLSQWLE